MINISGSDDIRQEVGVTSGGTWWSLSLPWWTRHSSVAERMQSSLCRCMWNLSKGCFPSVLKILKIEHWFGGTDSTPGITWIIQRTTSARFAYNWICHVWVFMCQFDTNCKLRSGTRCTNCSCLKSVAISSWALLSPSQSRNSVSGLHIVALPSQPAGSSTGGCWRKCSISLSPIMLSFQTDNLCGLWPWRDVEYRHQQTELLTFYSSSRWRFII